ncbi:MAG: hypothetical protein WCG92_26150, partial [Hyphomicrobiales bacterium]
MWHRESITGIRPPVALIRRLPAALLALAWLLTAGAAAPARADDALLSQDVSALFAARTARIGPYVAWTYDWATSYANSYRAAYHVIRHLLTAPAGQRGDVLGVLRGLQQQSLRQRVSRPADDAYQIARLIDRHAAARLYVMAAKAVAAACTGSAPQSCIVRTLPQLQAASTGILAARREPMALAKKAGVLQNMLDIKQIGDVDVLLAIRPLATRILVLILRFTEFASIILLVTGSLRRVYVPDTVITRFAVALAISWSLDYGLLRVERAFNEDSFRAGLEA